MGFHTFAICAYGKSPYLEACIRSLKAQTLSSEIICVTSTPSDWLEGLLSRHDIPLFVRTGEKGIGNDWNYGVEKAEGRFVTVICITGIMWRSLRKLMSAGRTCPYL